MQVRDQGWSSRCPLVQCCDPFALKHVSVYWYFSIHVLLISIKPVLFSSGSMSKEKVVNTFQLTEMNEMNKHPVQQGALFLLISLQINK